VTTEVYTPPYAIDGAKLYQVLWLEGLAVYESRVLVPKAGDDLVLRSTTVATEVAQRWPALRDDLLRQLDSSSHDVIYAYMFDADPARLPRRAGYYLGMRIAEQVAATMTSPRSARSRPALRAAVEQALRELP
jgi:uncharacterized protein YjaZ